MSAYLLEKDHLLAQIRHNTILEQRFASFHKFVINLLLLRGSICKTSAHNDKEKTAKVAMNIGKGTPGIVTPSKRTARL